MKLLCWTSPPSPLDGLSSRCLTMAVSIILKCLTSQRRHCILASWGNRNVASVVCRLIFQLLDQCPILSSSVGVNGSWLCGNWIYLLTYWEGQGLLGWSSAFVAVNPHWLLLPLLLLLWPSHGWSQGRVGGVGWRFGISFLWSITKKQPI